MRLKIHISGLVQGVGFRPYVFNLAEDMGLNGYTLNTASGVIIEVEGDSSSLERFLIRLPKEKPRLSQIYSLQYAYLSDKGYTVFEIRKSDDAGERRAFIMPDTALCNDCLGEIADPKNRRFLYPFTNCTNCGPRYTLIRSLPYDRENTSMKEFSMCSRCESEYTLNSDRRFHAQPNACHDCGPWLSLSDVQGNSIAEREEALEKAVNFIRKGHIVAVKGLGGYHLICDATSDAVVLRLRQRKGREEKPLAVMVSEADAVRDEVEMNDYEKRTLCSVERPIVIVRKKEGTSLAPSVSPGNTTVGIFLPYTPLHSLIMRKLHVPVIATSANITDEPIVCNEKDAFRRLPAIADYLLTHNRDIVRRCDDSVVRVVAERHVPVRRSRGYVPVPITLPFRFENPVLALGPMMNSTIALGIDNQVLLSQHIGDLDTPLAMEFYEETVKDMLRLFDVRPEVVVADRHPGYFSTRFGERHFRDKLLRVQHHYAHILACMAENEVPEGNEVIGFAFDGTGYGDDGTVWGGEVMIASCQEYRRARHLRPFMLPGGEKAVKEPVRPAFSLLYETYGDDAATCEEIPLSEQEKAFFMNMFRKKIHAPYTSSMGRLFDAVASLIGLRQKVSYHAQAAIELEQCALLSDDHAFYPFSIDGEIIDQRPVIESVVNDVRAGVSKEVIARKFHNSVVEIILAVSQSLKDETGISTIVLTGGVFQNALLLEQAFYQLRDRGFTPLIHQLVPPNDGGIALGQALFGHVASSFTMEVQPP